MQRLLPLAILATALCTACASPPAPPEPPAHGHSHSTTVTITSGAVLPDPIVHVPVLSTVVWRNRTPDAVTILVTAATCGTCDTVLGFAPCAEGARSTGVAPGSVATLCFHELGSFAFVASGGAVEQHGTIVVEGELP